MRNLKENAMRTQAILQDTDLSALEKYKEVVLYDIEKLLSSYFALDSKIELSIERKANYQITIKTSAAQIKPFGQLK